MRRTILFPVLLLALILVVGIPAAGASRSLAPPQDPPVPPKVEETESGEWFSAPPASAAGREAALLNVTYVYTNSVPQPIVDNQCISVTLNVPDTFSVGDLNVGLWISHTYRSDLDIWLYSPIGTAIDLLTDPDAGADNLNVLVDQASPNAPDSTNHTAPPPWYSAWWHPDGSLNDVRLQNAQGQWSLQICDDAGGDTGTFNSATLFFETGFITLDPPFQEASACAFSDLTYPITLVNTTGVSEAFNLTYTSTWPYSGPLVTPVIPSPGQYTFTVTVHIPSSAPPGQIELVTVTATGTSGTAQATLQAGSNVVSGYTDVANAPRPVRNESVVYWDGKLYKIGGYDGAARDYLDIYDIATDTWTAGSPMPGARYWLDCVAIDGKIYCAGGYLTSAQSTLYIYDIAAGTWSTGTPTPATRYNYAGVALNGKYYVIGGYGTTYAATIWAYDPVATTWDQTLPNMSVARRYHSAGVIGGKIYVAGGYNPSYLSSAEVFDPAVPGWSPLPAMPSAWVQAGDAVKHDRFLMLFGGDDNSTATSSNLALMYDAVTNSWSWLPVMNHALYGAEADGDGSNVYIVSGRLYEGGTYSYSPYTTRIQQCGAVACQVQTVLAEDFEGTFPPAGWQVVDNGGSNCVWQRNDYWPRANYAGGVGFSAAADSDDCGSGTFMDTTLVTPPIDLSSAVTATLSYMTAYNDIGAGGDYAATDFRFFPGLSWTNLLTWDSDHSASGPGELVTLDLTSYAGIPNSQVAFHYGNATWDWWWQVDQIRVDACIPSPDIAVQPTAFDETLYVNELLTQTLNIANQALGPLSWSLDEGCGTPVNWLALDPTSGIVGANGNTNVNVSFTAGAVPGVFTTSICANSNDPDEPQITIPVTLTVVGLAEIAVAPPELIQTQPPDEVFTRTLTISNTGTANLDWTVHEAPSLAPEPGPVVPLAAGPDTEAAPTTRALRDPVALGDLLFALDAGTATADTQLLGVEYALGYYWVTGGNSGVDPNKLYKLDPAGTLVATYDQPATTGWGWRDLAFDGTYLYVSDESALVKQIDPATGAPTGVTFACPTSVCRALAYDPVTDHFWTANFSSSIWEFTRAGTIVNTFPNTLAVYGMGWDNQTSGGPYLWLWSQDGANCTTGFCGRASQVNPVTGALTGVVFDGVPQSPGTQEIAGGATIVPNLVPGKLVLVTLHQATPDFIVGYELADLACAPGDIPWLSLAPLAGSLVPGASTGVNAVFDSTGLAPGVYTGNVCVASNDMTDPQVQVPVTLTVEIPDADVSISIADAPDPVYAGALLDYTVTVNNAGPAEATGVALTDTLPAGVTFVSASAGCSHVGGVVTCALGSIASGGSVIKTITVRTDTSTPGPIVNGVVVAAVSPDPNTANNTATASTVKTFRIFLPLHGYNGDFRQPWPGKPR